MSSVDEKSPLVDSSIPWCRFNFSKLPQTERKSSTPSPPRSLRRHSMTTPVVCFKNIAIHSIFCAIYFHNFFFFLLPNSYSLTWTVGRDVELRNETKIRIGCHARRLAEVIIHVPIVSGEMFWLEIKHQKSISLLIFHELFRFSSCLCLFGDPPTRRPHELLNTTIGHTDMKRSDRKLKHGSCEWKAGRRGWATQKRKLMSSTSACSTRSRRSKRFVFRQDSAAILQSLDMISLQLFFMLRRFFFARAFGIHESFRSWNIYEPPLLRPSQSSSSRFQNFHAELHTYKHHIELFNQLTQKLIAVYPTDDTTRIKRMTETVNLR